MKLRKVLVPESMRRRVKDDLMAAIAVEQPAPLSLKYFAPAAGEKDMVLTATTRNGDGKLPVPPQSLWLAYGDTEEEFLELGRDHVARMRVLLDKHGFDFATARRILDFGCGAGRMIRFLQPQAEEGEVWGCDINADHIQWAQQNLRPPFRFLTCTMLPHLPFPDGHFDLIYAGSVFTHIGDLAQAWLLELRRIIRPGGFGYLTIHDRNTAKLMRTPDYSWVWASRLLAAYGGLPDEFGMLALDRWPEKGGTIVFYDLDWFRETLAPMFRVVAVEEAAYGYQTAVVVEAT